jgi:hypothetical protein
MVCVITEPLWVTTWTLVTGVPEVMEAKEVAAAAGELADVP